MICAATRNAISSPESADGRERLQSLDGQMTFPFGPDHAPVNRLVVPASDSELTTPAICGRGSDGLSKSESLQLSLESKLRQRMDAYGSIECELTLKQWDMQSGPPIFALRASARRILDSAYTGSVFPTPEASDCKRRYSTEGIALRRIAAGKQLGLEGAAILASWSTASARDWKDTEGQSTKGINPDGSERIRMDQLPESGVFPLAYGIPRGMGKGRPERERLAIRAASAYRVGSLKGYGNAIVPQLAAEFILAAMAC